MSTLHKIIFRIALAVFFSNLVTGVYSQIVINEASNMNATIIADEDGEFEDWIELFNNSSDPVSLFGWSISDNPADPQQFIFSDVIIESHGFRLLYASGKSNGTLNNNWQVPVSASETWNYLPGSDTISLSWINNGYNSSAWLTGPGGFGYADGDDETVLSATVSVFIRKTFNVTSVADVYGAILYADYDDGFVAYLNGTEITRSMNMGDTGWDDVATYDHEAIMYQGYDPEVFPIDSALVQSLLVPGENVLAIQVHNTSLASSDLSAIFTLALNMAPEVFAYPPYSSGTTGNIHLNFKLNNSGETVFLYNPAGVLQSQILVSGLGIDQSLGCVTDGSATIGYFMDPTPGSTNNTDSYSGIAPVPTMNPGPGFYESGVSVTLTSPSPLYYVRYTLTGDEPTASSPIYISPINVGSTRVVKARCFEIAGNLLPSPVITNTYVIEPEENISLPVISISTDSLNLYGDNGIYDNWSTDWKKPCYIEYFEKNGNHIFEQRAGIKIDGGAGGSRSNAQRSFRVEPDHNVYGDGYINYPLIPDRFPVDKFGNIYLRNGSNYWNSLPYKEAAMQRVMKNTNNLYLSYTPVVAFLNGKYWGVYELREKADQDWIENIYGGDKNEVDILSMSYWYGPNVLRVTEGSDTAFYTMRDYINNGEEETAEYLNQVGTMLDIDNYIDYMATEIWYNNTDWLWNNMKIARSRATDNKWKYVIQDMELGCNGWSNIYTNMYEVMFNDPVDIYTPPTNDMFSEMFYHLLHNPDFKRLFINRFADLMNTVLLPENTIPVIEQIHAQIRPEMERQYEKWDAGMTLAAFDGNKNYFEEYFLTRSPIAFEQTREEFDLESMVQVTLNVEPEGAGRIFISTIEPQEFPWTGTYFNGNPVKITAVPNPGYTFETWESSDLAFDLSNAVFDGNISNDNTFTAVFSGEAVPVNVVVSEINYNSSLGFPTGDWIELYNYGPEAVNLDGWVVKDEEDMHEFAITGVTINSGERLIISADTTMFKALFPGVTLIPGELNFGFGPDADEVRLFNTFGDLVTNVPYMDSDPWDSLADGTGMTLEWLEFELPQTSPAFWFAGCVPGGTPGEMFTPCGVSVEKHDVEEVFLYPNPTDGEIFIYTGSSEINNIRVYNLQGLCVYESTNLINNKISLPENILDGLYFVMVGYDDGRNISKKIILKR